MRDAHIFGLSTKHSTEFKLQKINEIGLFFLLEQLNQYLYWTNLESFFLIYSYSIAFKSKRNFPKKQGMIRELT